MRLGLLGPAGDHVAALGKAAEFLLNGARVHRAIYLGRDGALDRTVAAWAFRLVGDDPSDDAAWRRAVEVAIEGDATILDAFVETERARLRLKSLETLPEDGFRAVTTVFDRKMVTVHDSESFEEDDLLSAELLVFGKSARPLVRRSEERWILTPGPIGPGFDGGVAVLDDEHDGLTVTIYDALGARVSGASVVVDAPDFFGAEGRP